MAVLAVWVADRARDHEASALAASQPLDQTGITIKTIFVEDVGLPRRALLLSLIAIAVAAVDVTTEWLLPLRFAVSTAVVPIHVLADVPGRAVSALAEQLQSRSGLVEERQQLLREREALQLRLQRLTSLETENARLRGLLGSRVEPDLNVRVAEVIGLVPDPDRRQFIVDRGGEEDVDLGPDGLPIEGGVPGGRVHEGQAVLNSQGLVGQVVAVNPLGARVLLLTDPQHSVPAEVRRNGLRVIVSGTGHPQRLDVPHVTETTDIAVGDELITSGLGGVFPRGYPVATVSSIDREPGAPFLKVSALPSAKMDTVSHVLLVLSPDGDHLSNADMRPGT